MTMPEEPSAGSAICTDGGVLPAPPEDWRRMAPVLPVRIYIFIRAFLAEFA
jgi:hypothetical protein